MFVVGTPQNSCYYHIVEYICKCSSKKHNKPKVIHGAELSMSSKIISYSRNRICLKLPDIPADKWCDFRCAYEQGKTLKQIAVEYHCDPRTVRKSLFLNQGSNDIGKQNCGKKITAFIPVIDRLYQKYTCINNPENSFPDTDLEASAINNLVSFKGSHTKEYGLCKISKLITDQIKAEGYTGSERTVRNYLRSRFISIQPDT